MSPLRHDEQGTRVVPSWQSVIEEKIAEARERGEFDDLPGTGQPLRIQENPLAGDWELAFHVLENAEMAPPWMEMSREVQEGMAELAALRERTARYLADQRAQAGGADRPAEPDPAPHLESPPRWWRWWTPHRLCAGAARDATPVGMRPAALEAERLRARRRYLEQAARIDEVIAAYNASLPENLRRLQKPRLRPGKAGEEFDIACPPVSADAGA